MATNYKILGQLNPTANVLSAVYTVPSANQAVISTIIVCNQSIADAAYSIAVVPGGETDNVKHYIVRGGAVPAADALAFSLGLSLGAGDVVRANTTSGNLSFSIFGAEIEES
jgi:hypothetical protein